TRVIFMAVALMLVEIPGHARKSLQTTAQASNTPIWFISGRKGGLFSPIPGDLLGRPATIIRRRIPSVVSAPPLSRRCLVSENVIEVQDLTKVYPDGTQAVQGVSFTVGRGEVFGFLGPNGAGKTTTIQVLITLLARTDGQTRVLGLDTVKDADAIRRR